MKLKIISFLFILNFESLIANTLIKDPNLIFKNLRCLICQGQSVADSNSEFAQTLKLVVKDKIAEGKTEEEIYNFLIEKYGDWIVYKPPFNKANTILWILPYIVLVIGGFFIFSILRKKGNH
tara:strand:+ start:11228 stop:11593 length:366 start_codon:yes stop_codon:yes gene_type:complete